MKHIPGGGLLSVEVPSGTAVDEGTDLYFTAENIPQGKTLDKWLLNGKKEVMPHAEYQADSKHAVVEDNKKAIKVTFE